MAKGKTARADTAERHSQLLKRSAAAPRPKWAGKPVHHCGGRIYWSEGKHGFRVYARKGDRVEQACLLVERGNETDKCEKFQIDCAVIESDERPVVQ